LAICVCWPLLACASTGHGDQQPKLLDSQIETKFSVNNAKLIVSHGDKSASENDNDYLLSALSLKKIYFTKYDYSVTVSRKQYSTNMGNAEESLELFHYSVRFKGLKNPLKSEFPVLGEQDFIETYIPLSKAPTKCYVYTTKHRLNLLCHYGLKRNDSMSDIISQLKNSEM
jgi:hypothetical protein